MTILHLPVKSRWQRLHDEWKQASRLHLSPEYRDDAERGRNHRYYR